VSLVTLAQYKLTRTSWLLEYDSATFASYINTLQRQHFRAEKLTSGPGRHMHDWFNAKAASLLVEASQGRVSRQSLIMDNEPDIEDIHRERAEPNGINGGVDEFADDMSALHDAEELQGAANGGVPLPMDDDEIAVMETFATQTQTVRQERSNGDAETDVVDDEEDEDSLREVTTEAPPVFRPLTFSGAEDLTASVKRRLRKGHEAVLEEQPKWSLLAKILKEIENTIARVAETHAGMALSVYGTGCSLILIDAPGTNIVLIMASSDRTCLQLRQYLTTMEQTDPPFSADAGRKMLQTLFLSNWQHEKNGERLSNPARMNDFQGGDEVRVKRGEMEEKLMSDANRRSARGRGMPAYKRRRLRGGQAPHVRRSTGEEDM